MEKLRVRVYNVRFGDAILIRIPDKDPNGEIIERYILIDVGNAWSKEGGADVVFQPVIEDILSELNGHALDLYIMTHEHTDHVQGLLYAEQNFYPESNTQLKEKLDTQYAWLTASAEKNYKNKHKKAEKAKLNLRSDYAKIRNYIHSASYIEEADPQQLAYLENILRINNLSGVEENVEYLRNLAKETSYVYQGIDLAGKHPFNEAQFEIWAPEEDTSVYYGYYHSPALGMTVDEESGGRITLQDYYPPAGVDASVFYDLIDFRRQFVECLLAIDKAENNTSVVCCIEWRGWRLLFTGDAELKSWKFMRDKRKLKAVNFLKVSHHGSHNGTPSEDILDLILPKRDEKEKERCAVVSTYYNTYSGVPDPATLKRLYDPTIAGLQPRCDRLVMVDENMGEKLYEDFFFDG